MNSNDKILGIIFCEFDHLEGPKILHQKPVELISKNTFDSISSYLIPKDELKNRIVTVTINNYRICGYPVHMISDKFERIRYIYNTCFIFDKNTNTCSYEAVVKKLACDLRTLQTECEFLLRDETRLYLPNLLEQIYNRLNKYGECVIQKIGHLEHSSLFLKLIQKHIDPQYVQSFDVPVFIINRNAFEVDEWDLTTKKIVNAITGFKTIARISYETSIELSVVKENIQNLIYANIVMAVPVIQYSSMFVTTSKITELYKSKSLQNDVVVFVRYDTAHELPSFVDVFQLYSYFVHGINVKDYNQRYNPQEKNIDIKKLILFGLMKGYLRKMNKYPVKLSESDKSSSLTLKFNGTNNYDKLCSNITVKDLDEQIDKDANVVVYIK